MADNPLRLKSIHHVEFWVGNAKQAAYYYRQAFGFSQFAYAGLETGRRDATSYALQQGKARLVLTTPLDPDDPINDHVRRHGDGVRDIAFHVDDADAAFAEAVARGATPVSAPQDRTDEHGTDPPRGHRDLRRHDPLAHLVPRLPRPVPARATREATSPGRDAGLLRIDHMVGNVELGQMNHWADWYSQRARASRATSASTTRTSPPSTRALMSIVMSDDSYAIKFPINEPAPGRKKSQIDEYLDFYRGPGVQHVALLTTDIIAHGHDAARQRRRVPVRAAQLLRRARRARRRDRRGHRRRSATSASSSTATTRATCCSCSRSRSRTARRCSSRSSSARAAADSARATSRRCSSRSNASRRCGESLRRHAGEDRWAAGRAGMPMPIYHQLGHGPAQAAHRLPAARRRALHRGTDRQQGLHRALVAGLPRAPADAGAARRAGEASWRGRPTGQPAFRHRHFRTCRLPADAKS